MEAVAVSYSTLVEFNLIPAIVGKELDKDLEKEPLRSFLGYRELKIEKNLKQHTVVSIAAVEPKSGGDMAAFGGYLVILNLDHAATILGIKQGKVRRIDIALEHGVDPKKALVEIEKVLAGRPMCAPWRSKINRCKAPWSA